jgi:outer membrane receptor for ferrienterochelin and colicins
VIGDDLIKKANKSVIADGEGNYIINNLKAGDYEIAVSYIGFRTEKRNITLIDSTETTLDFTLRENNTLDEIVITGTLKPVSRLESPVPVEVYKPTFFK